MPVKMMSRLPAYTSAYKTAHLPVTVTVTRAKRSVAPAKLAPSKLQDAEDRLLTDAVEHHPRQAAAVDATLDDMAMLQTELHESRREPLLLRSTRNLNRIEDLLLEAIIRTHPNCNRALDWMLADLSTEDAVVSAELRERAQFDSEIDNDFDGMG